MSFNVTPYFNGDEDSHSSRSRSRTVMAECGLNEGVADLPRTEPRADDHFQLGVEKLLEQVTCGLCSRIYKDPKVLPCLHYFCESCIERWVRDPVVFAQAGNREHVRCPKCKRPHTVHSCEPKRLPDAFFVHELLNVYTFVKKAEGGVTHLSCEMCSKGLKAVAFCRHCEEFGCNFCALDVHKRMRQYAGHHVVKIEDLTRNHVPVKKPTQLMCRDHEDSELTWYCYGCIKLICRDCIVRDHKDHDCEYVRHAAPKCRDMLKGKLGPCRQMQQKVEYAAENITKEKTEVENQAKDIAVEIGACFDQIIEIISEQKLKMIEAANDMANEKIEDLDSQQKSFGCIASDVQEVIDFVERNVNNATHDAELMSLQKQMTDRVEEMHHKYEYLDTQPATKADIAFRSPEIERIKKLVEAALVYPTQANPNRSTVEGIGIRSAETNTSTSFSVQAIDARGEPCQKMQDVVARLKSLVDNSVVEAVVTDMGKGKYEATYKPRIRGRHSLMVKVNENPIQGSPFSVRVHHPPKLLGKVERVISSLQDPHGIAISQNHIAITEYGASKIAFLETDITANSVSRHSLEQLGDVHLKQPTGIAADEHGCFYVADAGTSLLMKFTPDGSLIKKIGGRGRRVREFQIPGGVTVHRDRVYVCDRGNHRVQIFTTDLEFIEKFGEQGQNPGDFDYPVAAAFDRMGDLFITDCNNHRILVFNHDGLYIRTFGTSGDEEGKLRRPAFIEIDPEDYVYVTEEQNNRISIFRTNGSFVRTVASKGGSVGELNFPKGLCRDLDGFIYVCDHGNHRVQAF